ncbi:type II toxin-antitoxin system Phd/YefM family antitoxin [Streptomyces erythrochromogenes]|uniref:type II toxin-antitoxin system Phd/YefM family antitoxin n=1 Tax=Streptomyces erythrochromogenes TaxID=285574 RepID=UPI0036F7A56D
MDSKTADEARTNWADLIGAARYKGEATEITWRGKPCAAVVPIDWFKRAVELLGEPGTELPQPAAE